MRAADTLTLDMFSVRPPEIRTPAPAAPGSASSRAGARNVAPRRQTQLAKILIALAGHETPISREQLSAETGIKESSLCGRLPELDPLWVRCIPDVCTSRAGVHVNGYQITAAGRDRVRELAHG